MSRYGRERAGVAVAGDVQLRRVGRRRHRLRLRLAAGRGGRRRRRRGERYATAVAEHQRRAGGGRSGLRRPTGPAKTAETTEYSRNRIATRSHRGDDASGRVHAVRQALVRWSYRGEVHRLPASILRDQGVGTAALHAGYNASWIFPSIKHTLQGGELMRTSKRFTSLAAVAALGLLAAACGSDSKSADHQLHPPAGGSHDTRHRSSGTTPRHRQRRTAAPGPATSPPASPSTPVAAATARSTTRPDAASTRPSASSASRRSSSRQSKDEDRTDQPRPAGAAEGQPDHRRRLPVRRRRCTAVAAANPDTTFAIVDSVVDAPERAQPRVRRERGLVPRRCRCGAEEQDRPHRLHRWRQEIDLIKKFEAGYIAGAKAVNPDIKIDSKYLGPAGDNSAWVQRPPGQGDRHGLVRRRRRRDLHGRRWLRCRHHPGRGRGRQQCGRSASTPTSTSSPSPMSRSTSSPR